MEDRFHPVLPPYLIPCRPPLSFYDYIEQFCPPPQSCRTLHRVVSLMRKMGAQTLVKEDLACRGELATELAATERRCGDSVEFKAYRWSFFSTRVTKDLLPYTTDDEYLGYVVFIDLQLPDGSNRRYVYESVISVPSFHNGKSLPLGFGLPKSYLHCVRRYCGWIGEHRFSVSGTFFSQQNNLTHVCAHAALRWLLNNVPERLEKVVSYEDVNSVLGIDHVNQTVGQYPGETAAKGLARRTLEEVLDHYKHKFIVADFTQKMGEPQEYWRFIYSVIESGYPCLVFFTAKDAVTRHVVAVVGHTLCSDNWEADARPTYGGRRRHGPPSRAEYLPAASWVDHFIIHDDNYGMYFCMPAKALSRPTEPLKPFQVVGALGILPVKPNLQPLDAEAYAASILLAILYPKRLLGNWGWLERLRQGNEKLSESTVLRTLLVSKETYQDHLRSIEDVQGNQLKDTEINTLLGHQEIPSHFWVTEVTLADVYTANKRKLGEVLFRIEASETKRRADKDYYTKIFSPCIGIRLPGNIVVPKVERNVVHADFTPTELVGHVPMMRTCRASPVWEW